LQAGGRRFDPGPLHSSEVTPTTQTSANTGALGLGVDVRLTESRVVPKVGVADAARGGNLWQALDRHWVTLWLCKNGESELLPADRPHFQWPVPSPQEPVQ
jgi:hypothetical protein